MTKIFIDDGIIIERPSKTSNDGSMIYFNPLTEKYCAEKSGTITERDNLSEIWFLTGGWPLKVNQSIKTN